MHALNFFGITLKQEVLFGSLYFLAPNLYLPALDHNLYLPALAQTPSFYLLAFTDPDRNFAFTNSIP